MAKKTRRKQQEEMDEMIEFMGWRPAEIDNEVELTLLTAVSQIIEVVRDSKHDVRIYEAAKRPLSYIADLLGFTQRQALVYAIVMNIYYDKNISTVDMGRCLSIPPVQAMIFSDDLEELCRRNYIMENNDEDSLDKVYSVTREAVVSLQKNHPIVVKGMKVSSSEDWFMEMDKIVAARCRSSIDYEMFCYKVNSLIAENPEIPFVKQFLAKCGSLIEENKMLFLWICNMVVSDNYDTIEPDHFKRLYSEMSMFRIQKKSLAAGTNVLLKRRLIQMAQSDNQRTRNLYELTPWVIKNMLAEFDLDVSANVSQGLVDSTTITHKKLFYNAKEQLQIDQLVALLQPDRFVQVCDELHKTGFRSGFACLFYGAPGTGKTETVLQLARLTGRDIMQVNVSEIKSMWVGESEKNIKAVFSRYRKLVETSEVAPILLFNEADAIIGKRLENVSRSSDKMENAIQNIILEEIENLKGILIATTNLTSNLDSAFERRFIYKIEFEKPSLEAKCAIWKSMISTLSADDAMALASKYDFSGGQIENVARKSVVDRIIMGKELSVDALIQHCDAERLDKSASRPKIGF